MPEYSKLDKSLHQLERQYQNYKTMDKREYLTPLDKDGISESVIQRFETCYDMLWKHLKKYLEEETGLPEVPSSPKPVFRLAYENKLIENITDWLEYVQARIDTSHDYNEEKSLSTLGKISNFINDAIDLYERMSGETWKRV